MTLSNLIVTQAILQRIPDGTKLSFIMVST